MKMVNNTGAKDRWRLTRLAREGIVRAGRASLARSIIVEKPPRLKSGASVVAILIDERRHGR
jgi:hypothetical protein